ncbi:hypothetical protein HDV02_001696 [Globomyces sp. JEL0801]|nr:hypothetical protein HDV02_001696 [Globomyces sp. JEL0801]
MDLEKEGQMEELKDQEIIQDTEQDIPQDKSQDQHMEGDEDLELPDSQTITTPPSSDHLISTDPSTSNPPSSKDPISCYCQSTIQSPTLPQFQCTSCFKLFHQQCIPLLKLWDYKPLLGDHFYHYTCLNCGNGTDSIKRSLISLPDVLYIALFNLSHTKEPPTIIDNVPYFSIKSDIVPFVEKHWDQIWSRHKSGVWKNHIVTSLLSAGMFMCSVKMGDDVGSGYWALKKLVIPPIKKTRPSSSMITKSGILLDFEDKVQRKRRKMDDDGHESTPVTQINYPVEEPLPKKPKKKIIKSDEMLGDEDQPKKKKPVFKLVETVDPQTAIKKGDILTCCISLPKSKGKDYDIIDPVLLYRLFDEEDIENSYVQIKSNPLVTLPNSKIEYYVNGQPLGTAFTDLLQGKYHAAISLYNGAQVELNFGPKLKYPIEGYQALCFAKTLPRWSDLLEEYCLWMDDCLKKDKRKASRNDKKKMKEDMASKTVTVSNDTKTTKEVPNGTKDAEPVVTANSFSSVNDQDQILCPIPARKLNSQQPKDNSDWVFVQFGEKTNSIVKETPILPVSTQPETSQLPSASQHQQIIMQSQSPQSSALVANLPKTIPMHGSTDRNFTNLPSQQQALIHQNSLSNLKSVHSRRLNELLNQTARSNTPPTLSSASYFGQPIPSMSGQLRPLPSYQGQQFTHNRSITHPTPIQVVSAIAKNITEGAQQLPADLLQRHNMTGNVHHSHIRNPEDIIKDEERYLGRRLTPDEIQMVKDRVAYLREHEGHEAQHSEMLLIILGGLIVSQIAMTVWKKYHIRSYNMATLTGLWLVPMNGISLMFYALYFGTLGRDCVDRLSDKMATTMGYYSRTGFPKKHLRENMCAICGEITKGSTETLHRLNCHHTYHEVCIRGWTIVGKKDVCPYCKEKVDLNTFKTNSWDTTQVFYLNLLDAMRYILVWNPIVFLLINHIIDFLDLK